MSEESKTDSIQDSIKEAISERVKNPLLGSFAISWLIVNWQFVAVLVKREGPIEETIKVLKTSYSDTFHILWLPLIISSALVLFYPWLTLVIMIVRTAPQFMMEQRKISEEVRLARLRINLSDYRSLERKKVMDIEERMRNLEALESEYKKARKA